MKRTWEMQDRLAEVVEEALQNGPQLITKMGVDVAVVLPQTESATLREPHRNLAQFFLESPLVGSGLDLTRDRRRT